MISVLSLALVQSVSGAEVPVVLDAPPALLFAAYEQCLDREVDLRVSRPISAEEVFDESQRECGYLLDAYVAKLTSNIVTSNIDYQQEKARAVTNIRAAVVTRVTERRASASVVSDAPVQDDAQ